jgi:hypothetical protein
VKRVDLGSCAGGHGALGTGSDEDGALWTVLQGSNKAVKFSTGGQVLGCYPDDPKTPNFAAP